MTLFTFLPFRISNPIHTQKQTQKYSMYTYLHSIYTPWYTPIHIHTWTRTPTHMHTHTATYRHAGENLADSLIKVTWQDSFSIHLYSWTQLIEQKHSFWSLYILVDELLDSQRPHNPNHTQGKEKEYLVCLTSLWQMIHAKLAITPAGIVTDSSTGGWNLPRKDYFILSK